MVMMSSQQARNLKDEVVGYEFDNANYSFMESTVTVVDFRDAGVYKNQIMG